MPTATSEQATSRIWFGEGSYAVIGDLPEVEQRLSAALKSDTPFVYFDLSRPLGKRVCVNVAKVLTVEAEPL